MTDLRVITNQNFGWFVGPDSGISDWAAPTLSDLTDLENVSEGTRVDGTDFNVEASEQSDDRSFTDAAGAQTRSYPQFGGNIEGFVPEPGDTTSASAVHKGYFGTPRTKLALLNRPGVPNTPAIAAGDEVNLFHVMTDGRAYNRQDTGYSYGVNLVPRDDVLIGYIVPSTVPTSVVAVTADAALAVGEIGYITVTYEGRNITVGATYSSSDTAKAEVTASGAVVAKVAGSVTITVDYPGAGAPDTVVYTIS